MGQIKSQLWEANLDAFDKVLDASEVVQRRLWEVAGVIGGVVGGV